MSAERSCRRPRGDNCVADALTNWRSWQGAAVPAGGGPTGHELQRVGFERLLRGRSTLVYRQHDDLAAGRLLPHASDRLDARLVQQPRVNRSTSGRNRPTCRNAVARSLASASLNTPSFVSITSRKLRRRPVWFSARTTLTDGSPASPLGGLVPAAPRRSPFRVTRHQFRSRIAPETPRAWRPTGRRHAEREPQRLGADRAVRVGSPPALGQRTTARARATTGCTAMLPASDSEPILLAQPSGR